MESDRPLAKGRCKRIRCGGGLSLRFPANLVSSSGEGQQRHLRLLPVWRERLGNPSDESIFRIRSDSVRTDTGKIEGFRGRRHGMLMAKRKYFPSQQRIDVSSLLSGSSDWEHVSSNQRSPTSRRQARTPISMPRGQPLCESPFSFEQDWISKERSTPTGQARAVELIEADLISAHSFGLQRA